MTELQALLLGIIQGLTEFLPVSSSGHLEIGHALLGIHNSNNLLFAVIVHSATVLSTIFVFRKDIWILVQEVLKFNWNDGTLYILKIFVSTIPVIILGLFFKDSIEALFGGNIAMVGSMLLVTAVLLLLTHFAKPKEKGISFFHAILIGVAQAMAVLPGISRSGATIATGLLLGNKKEEVTRFSFLMVLIPIIGAFLLDVIGSDLSGGSKIEILPLVVGFVAAFISGLVACKWMIKIVRKGKLIYFAIYCLIIGLIAIFAA